MDAPLVEYVPALEEDLENILQGEEASFGMAPPMPTFGAEASTEQLTTQEWDDWCALDTRQ